MLQPKHHNSQPFLAIYFLVGDLSIPVTRLATIISDSYRLTGQLASYIKTHFPVPITSSVLICLVVWQNSVCLQLQGTVRKILTHGFLIWFQKMDKTDIKYAVVKAHSSTHCMKYLICWRWRLDFPSEGGGLRKDTLPRCYSKYPQNLLKQHRKLPRTASWFPTQEVVGFNVAILLNFKIISVIEFSWHYSKMVYRSIYKHETHVNK